MCMCFVVDRTIDFDEFLQFIIDKQGTARDVQVEISQGFRMFDYGKCLVPVETRFNFFSLHPQANSKIVHLICWKWPVDFKQDNMLKAFMLWLWQFVWSEPLVCFLRMICYSNKLILYLLVFCLFVSLFVFTPLDGTGHITLENLKRACKDAGVKFTDLELRDMIEEADRNGDNMVDLEEFTSIMLKTNLFWVMCSNILMWCNQTEWVGSPAHHILSFLPHCIRHSSNILKRKSNKNWLVGSRDTSNWRISKIETRDFLKLKMFKVNNTCEF